MSTTNSTAPQMVTMQQVGVTLGFSMCVLCGTLFAFAVAIRCQSTNIAPRCEARPREVIYNPSSDADPSQKRGSPFLMGWVFWVLGLTYDVMLAGVPGTGTRKLGLKGEMLKVNLDHLVLIRFNALCYKIATFTTIVYCAVCLPIFFFARCNEVPLGEFDAAELDYPGCSALIENGTVVFTSYSRFTLANVPNSNPETYFTDDLSEGVNLARLIVVALSTWLVSWYVCFELFNEWVDMLAIRRVYYLERDLWKCRRKELKATMLSTPRHMNEDEVLEESQIYEREAWIPHPEQRDTPPNIELYSVLIGGIPSKPEDAINPDDLEAALKSGDDDLDWQMNVVSAFFDSCVPNQPGYSSSVAAVTILPSATDLAIAWKAWAGLGKLLSRLRFIRRRLFELGEKPNLHAINDGLPSGKQERDSNRLSQLKYEDSVYQADRRKEYSAEILGAGVNDDVNDEFWKSLDLGPEQVAVYNVEMSKSAAGCCPHGFCQERITYCSDLNTLRDMEEEAADDVKQAYLELKRAGESATTHKKKKDHILKLDKLDGMLDKMLMIDASDKLERCQSTTELHLLRKRHQSSRENGLHVTLAETNLPARTLEREGSEASFETARSHLERPRGLDAGLMRLASVRPRNSFVDPDHASPETDLWSTVETIASETKNLNRDKPTKYKVANGRWHIPTLKRGLRGFRKKLSSIILWSNDNSKSATDVMARDSTFAVVTFTSRQGAIAARKCLADGRGAKSFETMGTLPVPPLADSAAFNICDCRGFTRPVTIGLNDHQKNWRKAAMVAMVASVYIFFTAAVTAASRFGTEAVNAIYPGLEESGTSDSITGLVDSGILSAFLALLPDTFLWLANFGSNATSLVEAENAALKYYWNFMYIYAIVGSSIAQMVIGAVQNGSVDIYENMTTVAKTIPVQITYTWLNWIILKSGVFHPLFYLLQTNTFLSSMFGLKCCARLFRGGGAGNRLPYRIYVESGTVILCALALAPQAPLVSPFALLFFTICAPIKRWIVIFTYRPAFDSGGSRWPLLFDMIITSIVVGQVLLFAVLLFKNSYVPCILALVPILAVFMFRRMVLKRFLEAFQDAALLQTSMLDGWEAGPESEHLSFRAREEFRRFLVDAHKASYVPVCVAAVSQLSSNQITAEPAFVQPLPNDEPEAFGPIDEPSLSKGKSVKDMRDAFGKHRETMQCGALNRRRLISTRNLSITSDESPEIGDDATELAPLRRFFPEDTSSVNGDADPPETALSGERPVARTKVLGRVIPTVTSGEGVEYMIESSEKGSGEWDA